LTPVTVAYQQHLEKVIWNEWKNTTLHSRHSATVSGAYGTLVDQNDDGNKETGLGSGETGLTLLIAQSHGLNSLLLKYTYVQP
jgi:hypothetical protein